MELEYKNEQIPPTPPRAFAPPLGRTLRDEFAMAAMQGFAAGIGERAYNDVGIAIDSYDLADAMLAERAKRA